MNYLAVIIAGVGWYSRKTVLEQKLILQTDRNMIEDLQHKLEILQKYSEEEKKMIEEQIRTFRKEMGVLALGEEARGITPGLDTPTRESRELSGHSPVDKQRSTGIAKVVDDMKRLLIDAKELKSEQIVGKGSFGQVYKGFYRGMTVAVKTMNSIDKEGLERWVGGREGAREGAKRPTEERSDDRARTKI